MMKYLIVFLSFLLSLSAWTAYSPGTFLVDQTGTNAAAVKPASTAAIATDPALVVSVSPNTPIAIGSSALPTGASTSALQTTGNTSLASILAALPTSLGQKTMANSLACTLASDQTSIPLSPGAATSANQSTEITHLTSIDTKTPALGAAATAASTPVNIASDQVVPVFSNDIVASGNITATNSNPNTGTPTAGSTVAVSPLNGQGVATVQITGTYTGALTFQVTADGVNWLNQSYATSITGTPSIVSAVTSAQTGEFQANVVGQTGFRISCNGAITGSAAVTIRASAATAPVLSQVALAAGAANIGTALTNFVPVAHVTDVASAAIITTTTSASLSPNLGISYSVNIPVTAVSGTSPTLSVAIQESTDSGTNWYTVYVFPTITTTGDYYSPYLVQSGSTLRYVQTVGGSSPSFTRSIVRNASNQSNTQSYKNFIDTAIVPSTTNSTTASVYVENLNTYTAIVNQGTGGSAVTFALDGSDDNVSWVNNLAQVVGVVGGSTPVAMSYAAAAFRYIRVRVVTGVASATISYVSLVGSMGNGGTVQTKSPLNSTGSGSAASATVSTVITLTAPANAVGAFLMNLDTSTANVRWAVNRTASATLGQQLQPARDQWIPTTTNISLCAESGTQNYDVQWISQ